MTQKKLLISTENAEFQIIESLKTNRTKRSQSNEIFIEGIESIKQALKARVELTRIITTKKVSSWAANLITEKAAENNAPKIIEMNDELYKKLCDRTDPSEMLVTAKIRPRKASELPFSESPFIIVLDRPSDTGNLGSIIRSANAFNVDAVLIMGHAVDPWDPKTIRSSLGSIFFTPVAQLESLSEFETLIKNLKAHHGISVWGSDSEGASPLSVEKAKRPIMLVLGNEAKGISIAIKNLCDKIVSIPISGEVNSLNVASAASIFIWEIFKASEENRN